MAYVGKGADELFLGIESGVAKWLQAQAAAGGGIGVTVAGPPVVADFETLNDAIADSNTVLNVIGDVVEPSNVAVGASGLTIRMFNSPTLDMGANSFVWSTDDSLSIRGNAIINYSASPLFDANGNQGRVIVDGAEINNTLVATGVLTNGTRGRFTGCVFGGGLRLDGIKNTVTGADIASGIALDAGGENNIVSSCQLDGSIFDAASGTILADIRRL